MKKESIPTKHYWKDVFRDFSPKYGLLGHQISYSLSPKIHRFVMKTLGIQGDYKLLDVPPQEFDEFMDHPHTLEMNGLNVTKPYKWLTAKKFGKNFPVNTIYGNKNNKQSTNTDCLGFMKTLEINSVPIEAIEQMIIFGGGGFSYSILKHIQDHHSKISLICATRKNAPILAGVHHIQINKGNELTHLNKEKQTLILHATSSNDPFQPIELYASLFTNFHTPIFIDANYNEKRTKIYPKLNLKMKCIDGLPFLVEQARESQLLWWGKTLKTEQIIQHLKDTSL